MADNNALGSVVAIGAIGGIGYLLWKSMKARGAAPSDLRTPTTTVASQPGGGVLLPQYAPTDTWPSNLNIDWSNLGTNPVGSGVLLPQYQSAGGAAVGSSGSGATQTPLGPVSAPSWYSGGQINFSSFGDCRFGGCAGFGDDPRVSAWIDLAGMIAQCQGQIDAAWASYSSSLFNRLCAGTGFCPSYQNTADMVTATDQLAASLISLAQELAGNPDATYEDGSKKSVVFQQSGSRFVGHASSIVAQLGDNSYTAAIKDFIVRIPQSIQDVLLYTVDTAGNLVKSAAWSIGETVLIFGAAAAAVVFLLKKSGARIHAGPIQIG